MSLVSQFIQSRLGKIHVFSGFGGHLGYGITKIMNTEGYLNFHLIPKFLPTQTIAAILNSGVLIHGRGYNILHQEASNT